MQEGKLPISDPTKLTDTHPHPEEDACLVPSIEPNLTGAAYSPNGFSQVAMTKAQTRNPVIRVRAFRPLCPSALHFYIPS